LCRSEPTFQLAATTTRRIRSGRKKKRVVTGAAKSESSKKFPIDSLYCPKPGGEKRGSYDGSQNIPIKKNKRSKESLKVNNPKTKVSVGTPMGLIL